MDYSAEEMAWITRKAKEFADQSEFVDPIALHLAKAEFERLREQPRAEVVPIECVRNRCYSLKKRT